MRQDIHFHYDQLTQMERDFVDQTFRDIFKEIQDYRMHGVRLIGDDKCERAIDALARALIESRDA